MRVMLENFDAPESGPLGEYDATHVTVALTRRPQYPRLSVGLDAGPRCDPPPVPVGIRQRSTVLRGRDPRVEEDKITLTVVSSGYKTIEVDATEYLEAKAGGAADQFLDVYLSAVDTDDLVFEPDGGSYDPFSNPHGPDTPEPLPVPYGHVGRCLVRRTETGFAPIGVMADETLASYVAGVLNAAVAPTTE